MYTSIKDQEIKDEGFGEGEKANYERQKEQYGSDK